MATLTPYKLFVSRDEQLRGVAGLPSSTDGADAQRRAGISCIACGQLGDVVPAGERLEHGDVYDPVHL